jgi:two-component system, chemotaxis family, chemotaxis protein CheY
MIVRILIVDDSPVARKILKSMIPKDAGYELTEAIDGQDAIDKYFAFKPDITFLDLTMPVKDGFQALAEIKEKDPDALIVILTADVQQKSITRILSLGAFTIIRKPPKLESITEVISRVNDVLAARQENKLHE